MEQTDAILAGVGERIARDLLEQAARSPEAAAREAGCVSEAEIASWVDVFRPPAESV